MSWLKRRLPKKRWKRVCIYILSGFVILVAADMVLVQCWRHVDVSWETTRITAPLKADGLPDYVAARNAECSQGVTAENNAAPELLKIVGTDQFPQAWREQVLPQLDMSAMGSHKLFVNYDEWLKTHTPPTLPAGISDADQYRDDEWDATIRKPWKGKHPDRLAWLNGQQEALVRLHAALTKNRFYMPWHSASPGDVTTDLMPWLGQARTCSMLLEADAMRAAGNSDAEAFCRDVVDISKLARLATQGSTLIEYLEGLAIEGDASKAVQQGTALPEFLRTKDATELLHAWETMSAFPDESRVLDKGERFFALSTFCDSSRIGLQSAMEYPAPHESVGRFFFPIHYNAALRTFNHYYDEIGAAWKLPTYKQRDTAMKAVETELATTRNFLNLGEDLIVAVIPSFSQTFRIQESALVQHDLATLSLALRIYQDEHGTFPESLADLSPGVLAVVPVDGFADGPFHYRREGTGYVVYSVGPDGKDDGGRDRKSAAKGEGWDIVLRVETSQNP